MNLKYFDLSEFDSPDVIGSGKEMNIQFLKMIEFARLWVEENNNKLGRPRVVFPISSGYRTEMHNKAVGGVKYSSHLKGRAADILYSTPHERDTILIACAFAGFQRFGISKYFIHIDNDTDKPPCIWYYESVKIRKLNLLYSFVKMRNKGIHTNSINSWKELELQLKNDIKNYD